MKKKKILDSRGQLTEDDSSTYRGRKRDFEDEEYIPVIIKRSDQTTRHPDDVLEFAIHEGLEQHKRSKLSLFLSALAAGLIIGFAVMSVATMAMQLVDATSFQQKLATALVYPLGFIICIMSGTQLFTEHTATALYPVLDRGVSIKSLLKVWGTILSGNLIGTILSAFILTLSDGVIGISEGYALVYEHITSYDHIEIFFSAILAGWLMAQGGWLVLGTPPGIGQLVCIFIVTFLIGFGGLHHSIAGAAEIFLGMIHAETPHFAKGFATLVLAVIGNLVGGIIFVGILNYGHIRQTR